MCLGVPYCVIEARGWIARCSGPAGEEQQIDLALVGEQPPGTWLLT
ncbi:MAG: HypC/HybG/HupF family hydrogenase formation chaperone, partial [Zoogloea sp.]